MLDSSSQFRRTLPRGGGLHLGLNQIAENKTDRKEHVHAAGEVTEGRTRLRVPAYVWMSVPRVSRTSSMPTTSVMAAKTIGYHRPE